MIKTIDMHTHSTASDGSMSPMALVHEAKKQGLSAIALTDHDTVEGVAEALAEGDKLGIEVIPGIEISLNYKPEMHILGYFPDRNKYTVIKNELNIVIEGRNSRNQKIINKLNELGVNITIEDVQAVAVGDIVGRPHIAKVLVAKGYARDIDDAFEKYLSKNGKAYFKRFELTPQVGIQAIRKAGGIPVLAHPIFLQRTYQELDKLLGELKTFGLMGIEAIYSENREQDTGNFLRLAIKHDLLVTGGSDYHGSLKPGLEMGSGRGSLRVEYDLLEKLKERYIATQVY